LWAAGIDRAGPAQPVAEALIKFTKSGVMALMKDILRHWKAKT